MSGNILRKDKLFTGRNTSIPGVAALFLSLLLSCLASSCHTPQNRSAPAAESPDPIYRYLPSARIIRVNPVYNYVILACTVLPTPGEQGKVYREDKQIADISVTQYKQGTYVTANILQGQPAAGDLVKFKQIVTENSRKEKP